MSALIGALRVTLGLDSAAFERDAKKASGTVSSLGKGLTLAAGAIGGALAAAGLSNLIGQAFDMASGLSEAADRAGVTVEALQKLQFAARDAGVSNELLETSLAKLSKSMGQAEQGSKSINGALASIGLSIDDLRGKTPDQQFRIIAEALSKTADQGLRTAAGVTLLGRGFSGLTPMIKGGSAALDEWGKKAEAAGIITTQQAKDLDDLNDNWTQLKNRMLVVTAQIMAALMEEQKWADSVDKSWNQFCDRAGKAAERMRVAVVTAIGGMVTSIKDWFKGTLSGLFDWFEKKARTVGDAWRYMKDHVGEGATHTKASLLTFADEGGFQLASFGDQAEAVSVRVQKTFKDMAEATLGALSQLTGSIKGGGFLDILQAVIGMGLQLGSIGVFGKTIAGNINGVGTTAKALPTVPGLGGSFQTASLSRGLSAANNNTARVEIYDTTGLFAMRVNGQIAQAAPGIATAGARGGVSLLSQQASRRLA